MGLSTSPMSKWGGESVRRVREGMVWKGTSLLPGYQDLWSSDEMNSQVA